MQRVLSAALVGGAAFVLSPIALAATQHYQCTVAPTSTLTQNSSLTLPLPGTWIGNYDATANPTGTQTRPNLSGGSGNTAIPFTSTVHSTIAVNNSHPSGSFELGFDSVTGVVEVNKLFMDALSDTVGTISTTIVLSFGNFHTVAPTAIYFGVSNFSLPLDSGQLTRADATQTGVALGAATPSGVNTWTFVVAVPVDYMIEGSALGQAFGGDPIPAALALSGTLTLTPTGIEVSAAVSSTDTQTVPSLGTLTAQPLDLPTVIPPGSTAHLLVTGTFGEGTLASTVNAQLTAPGVRVGIPGDFNNDGSVDGADLGALLGYWGTPAGDLNNDGSTDGGDLGVLLGNWT